MNFRWFKIQDVPPAILFWLKLWSKQTLHTEWQDATSCLCSVAVRISSPLTHLFCYSCPQYNIVCVSAHVKQQVKQVLQAEHQTSV